MTDNQPAEPGQPGFVRGNERLDQLLADPQLAADVAAAHVDAEEMDRVNAMNLAMIRKAAQMTQVEVARKLGVGQGVVSRLEHRDDMLLSTLYDYLMATGAEGASIVVIVHGHRIELDLSGLRKPPEQQSALASPSPMPRDTASERVPRKRIPVSRALTSRARAGDTGEVDRQRAEAHLRVLAEEELRRPVSAWGERQRRIRLVAEMLTAIGALDVEVADRIGADFDLAVAVRQADARGRQASVARVQRRSGAVPFWPAMPVSSGSPASGPVPGRLVRLGQGIPFAGGGGDLP